MSHLRGRRSRRLVISGLQMYDASRADQTPRRSSNPGACTTEMLQYDHAFTDALQFMWGKGFLSPGGAEEVEEMLSGCQLSGLRVLDIGSGLGGIDILLATKHGAAEVIGIDVEPQL